MVGQPIEPSQAADRVLKLEKEFHSNGIKYANKIVEILQHIDPKGSACAKAIHAARRVLVSLEEPATLQETLRKWVLQRRSDYTTALVAVLTSAEASKSVKEAAITGAALTHADVWSDLLRAIFERTVEVKEREIVLEYFVKRFADLRISALELIRARVGDLDMRLEVLAACVDPVEEPAARKKSEKISDKDLRKAFGAAWMSVVSDKALTQAHRRDILERVPAELIPNMSDPLALADFLTDSYNNGKDVAIAISALDGLFVLISKHGLDYPLFYPKLYALMSPEALFYADGRKRFLELAAAFLKQGAMLPGGMVAAFVKRMTRRALYAPPEGALWCLRLALDLLYKHPNVSYLVHRAVNLFDTEKTVEAAGMKRPRVEDLRDPYNDDELDPQASNADQSSLWELEVLAKHISPAVSRLVLLFSKDVRKNPKAPPGDLSDYASLTFVDTFQAEFKRRAKSHHLAYDAPGSAPGLADVQRKFGTCMEWS